MNKRVYPKLVAGYSHWVRCRYCGDMINFIVKSNDELEGIHVCYDPKKKIKALNYRKDD